MKGEDGLSGPIRLGGAVEEARFVAAIGYPAWDGRRNEPSVMRNIFDDVYDVKRLQPGQLLRVTEDRLGHDCSTLGANSGSVLIDLESGEASGLHFAGLYRVQNYAVPSATVARRLADLNL
jgi:endonuclease G